MMRSRHQGRLGVLPRDVAQLDLDDGLRREGDALAVRDGPRQLRGLGRAGSGVGGRAGGARRPAAAADRRLGRSRLAGPERASGLPRRPSSVRTSESREEPPHEPTAQRLTSESRISLRYVSDGLGGGGGGAIFAPNRLNGTMIRK